VSYLLDTNVFSEMRKGRNCHPSVKSWWSGVSDTELHLSVIVLGEIRRGICRIQERDTTRARQYETWLQTAMQFFAGRILPVDSGVADHWGRITAGRSLPLVDSMLAATALSHDLILVTRNTRDISDAGARFLNPFES
jgi:predicted nucleic acid-binding protein